MDATLTQILASLFQKDQAVQQLAQRIQELEAENAELKKVQIVLPEEPEVE